MTSLGGGQAWQGSSRRGSSPCLSRVVPPLPVTAHPMPPPHQHTDVQYRLPQHLPTGACPQTQSPKPTAEPGTQTTLENEDTGEGEMGRTFAEVLSG